MDGIPRRLPLSPPADYALDKKRDRRRRLQIYAGMLPLLAIECLFRQLVDHQEHAETKRHPRIEHTSASPLMTLSNMVWVLPVDSASIATFGCVATLANSV